MRASIARCRAAQSAARVALEVPNEYEVVASDYANGTTIAISGTQTSRSGHTLIGNYGSDSDAVPVVVNSSLDGTRVITIDPSGSDSLAVYLYPSPGITNPVVYQRVVWRVHGGTTNNMDAGVMAWDQTTDTGTAKSAPHQTMDSGQIRNTTYDSGSESLISTETPSDVGTAWRIYEHAIDKSSGACVVRDWDGNTYKFTSSAMSTVDGHHPTFEWFTLGNPLTDKKLELKEAQASSVSGMSTAQRAYYNALLATEGEGPV